MGRGACNPPQGSRDPDEQVYRGGSKQVAQKDTNKLGTE